MRIDIRWFRLPNPPFDRILQFREIDVDEDGYAIFRAWQDVPVVDQE